MDAHTHRREGVHEKVYVLDPQELVSPPDNQFFCAGIHPWQITQFPEAKDLVRNAVSHPHCVGVGETGLDRLHPHLSLQEESLLWHWDLAEEHQKTLVLHVVRSSSDILGHLKRRRPLGSWIWHDFQGPLEVVEKVLKLHPRCYFSFGARGLSRSNSNHLWAQVPPHLRLIETDDSGLEITAVLRLSGASQEEMSKNFHTAFSL